MNIATEADSKTACQCRRSCKHGWIKRSHKGGAKCTGQSHQLPGQHWIKAAVELLARDATVTVTHQVGGVYGALTLHLHYL